MSVIGIDFGNESVYVAVARAGGIETITNDYSLRSTPSVVTFTENQRTMGVGAKNMIISHNKNTATNFKKLLGRKFRDPLAQYEIKTNVLTSEAVELHNGKIGFRIRYNNQNSEFTPEQISGMLFTKIRDITELAIGVRVQDCVVSVPSYFTDAERHAVMDAASIAGLNVLRLMNDTAAVALAYGITKQDLPGPEEQPRYTFFVDVGQSTTQIAGVEFNKGKLKVRSTVADPCLGGRDFDRVIAEYFAAEFKNTYRLDVCSSRRAWLRLLMECEKLKKYMSANTSELPLNIECFMEDKDVRSKMKRSVFEKLSEKLLHRLENLMHRCLQDSGLDPRQIHSVEIIGGSTRIPAVKDLISKVFGHTSSMTLNQDEAVARGCALMCAMLSPAFKVRDFNVSDVQIYPIHLRWLAPGSENGDMELFPYNHAVPFVKILTFYRSEPFQLEAYYGSKETPIMDKTIGVFTIKNITRSASGETPRVKVKAKVNSHGIFNVSSATMVEKVEVPDEPAPNMDATPVTGEQAEVQQNGQQQAEDRPEEEEQKKEVKDSANGPAPMETGDAETDKKQQDSAKLKMIAADRHEKERIDARNAVEEYTYEMRGKLSEEFSPFISDVDKEKFTRVLHETENWLYEEGEDCMKSVYVDRLQSLKKMGEPVVARYQEFEVRGPLVEEFFRNLQICSKFVDSWQNGDEAYSHIEKEEVEKVANCINEKRRWLEEKHGQFQNLPRHKDPPITSQQIRNEMQDFRKVVEPIVRKPKPKVSEPPTPSNPPAEEQRQAAGQEQAPQKPQKEEQQQPMAE
ncbi:unnamed protein product [Cyprideis torosa]|uniref:Uncharacterized protein n=1 Tax=Cyprideis torosa TaxID=163714 RepID=A0A7R8W688_9CRUS|nr:unnamed protein product [Cyprideis torosa]CAG0880795.1 unnamed protein product [Cyprideis torosa]